MRMSLSVFGSERSNYNLYLSVFFATVVPLSALELTEQIEWQVVLALCRLALVVVMLCSLVLATWDTDPDADGALSGFMFTSFPDAPYGSPLVNVRGLLVLLPLAVFANIFHHSIPALSNPVRDKVS